MTERQFDLDEALANSRARAVEFDEMIRETVSENLIRNLGPDLAETFIRDHQLLAWDLVDLFDSYQSAGVYPIERLPGVIDRAIDLKLQLYYVSQINPAVHNLVLSGTEFTLKNPQETPGLHLTHLCFMQAWIGQLRILWERLMTLVFYLEEGRDPGKSVRRRFFSRIAEWECRRDVLAEWESFISKYDETYRTPEYHNRSNMRKELFGHPTSDPNSIMSPMTPVMSGFWPVFSANARGVQSNIIALGRKVDPVLGPHYPPYSGEPGPEPATEPEQQSDDA